MKFAAIFRIIIVCRNLPESNLISPWGVLPFWFMFVLEPSTGARLDDLQVDMVTQLELISEVGLSRAGVEEVIRVVLAGDIAEPELSLRINRQPRWVDGFQPCLSLQHPVDTGVGPSVRRVAVDAKGSALFNWYSLGRFILEVVQLWLSHKDWVCGCHSPLVLGEALVLTYNDKKMWDALWEIGTSKQSAGFAC